LGFLIQLHTVSVSNIIMTATRPPLRAPSFPRKKSLPPIAKMIVNHSLAIFLCMGACWGFWLVFYLPMPDGLPSRPEDFVPSRPSPLASGSSITRDTAQVISTKTFQDVQEIAMPDRLPSPTKDFVPFLRLSTAESGSSIARGTARIPLKAFQDVLERAKKNQNHCHSVVPDDGVPEPTEDIIAIANITTARLPGFGVIQALEQWNHNPQPPSHITDGATNTQCQVPPENECGESQFTVIFMAYNPDRLGKLMNQIRYMLQPTQPFRRIIREIILVWNGPREINETEKGRSLLEYIEQESDRLRIVYPLKAGLPNDLLNRYHPDIVQVKTKAIQYYDDDGPFYSYEAVLGGFELWKRNSNAQIGAMARVIDLGPRQQAEKKQMLPGPELNDRAFVSHCKLDEVRYNYEFFANFEANMVLPSGSFLHSNYLCFIWHAAFEPIRDYVRAHPVHPDDITVSMMVSQLSGRSPKVYSRRINLETQEEQLKEMARLKGQVGELAKAKESAALKAQEFETQRRRLLFNINWDENHNMDDNKEKWAQLRSGAINSLVRYFGSMNSGSIGWCFGTEFHKKGKNTGADICEPEMARFGKLPWLNIDHTQKETCP
jgi:hypothetical protein